MATVVTRLKTVQSPPHNQAKVFQQVHIWHTAGLLGANARACRTEQGPTNQLAIHWIGS